MIGEFFGTLFAPILLFIFFPVVAGLLFFFEVLAPSISVYNALAFWIGTAIAQGLWLVILVRSFSKEK